MTHDLLLSGGQVLLPGVGLTEADILVSGGRIAALAGPGAGGAAKSRVDVKGLTVLPGVIDAHVHVGHGRSIDLPQEPRDLTLESSAAANGGVTTFIPYLLSPEPYESFFREMVATMEAGALVDFGCHFVVCTPHHLAQLPRYIREFGVPTFKLFMNFRGDEGKAFNLPGIDDGFLFELLEALAAYGGMLCPHPENIEIVWRLRERVKKLDLPDLHVWDRSRPAYVEAEALQRVALLGRIAGTPVYSVHTSSIEAVEAALSHRRRNAAVYIETCPHYLTHDYDSGVGAVGKVNPPLRSPADREYLWEAIRRGDIDTVASDHVARPREAKEGDIWKASAGFPGMEALLPIVISEGYHKRRIPLERLMALLAANPARLMGLSPRKGAIAVGADADLAIVDLEQKYTVQAADVRSGARYSLYEGWQVQCRVVSTLVRGTFAKRDGEVQPIAGHGRFISRQLDGNGRA